MQRIDIHRQNAEKLLGRKISDEEWSAEVRNCWKTLFFGLMYGSDKFPVGLKVPKKTLSQKKNDST